MKFAADLSDLRHRKGYHIILLHNKNVNKALTTCANEHYIFHDVIFDRGKTGHNIAHSKGKAVDEHDKIQTVNKNTVKKSTPKKVPGYGAEISSEKNLHEQHDKLHTNNNNSDKKFTQRKAKKVVGCETDIPSKENPHEGTNLLPSEKNKIKCKPNLGREEQSNSELNHKGIKDSEKYFMDSDIDDEVCLQYIYCITLLFYD